MPSTTNAVSKEAPEVTKCQWGGWLAVSRPGSGLMVGVTASSEQEARQRFDKTIAEWKRLLAEQQAALA